MHRGKKQIIPLEEHLKFARVLKKFRNDYVIPAFVGQKKKDGKMEQKAYKLIDSLRSVLDDIVYNDFKDTKDSQYLMAIYYGDINDFEPEKEQLTEIKQ